MSILLFSRYAKQLAPSKVKATPTGLTMHAPWGSLIDLDCTEAEAAELATFFGLLSKALQERGTDEAAALVAATTTPGLPLAIDSVDASEAFPHVEPNVVALPKPKRAYVKRSKP